MAVENAVRSCARFCGTRKLNSLTQSIVVKNKVVAICIAWMIGRLTLIDGLQNGNFGMSYSCQSENGTDMKCPSFSHKYKCLFLKMSVIFVSY